MVFMVPIEFRSHPAEHGKMGVSPQRKTCLHLPPPFFLRKHVGFRVPDL